MKMEEILKLIEAVSASTLTEFKYEENGTKLNLKKEQQKVEIVQNAASIPLTGISGGDFQATVLPQNMAVSGSSENADPEENLRKRTRRQADHFTFGWNFLRCTGRGYTEFCQGW